MTKVFIRNTEKLSAREQSEAAHELLKESLSELYSADKASIEIKKDSLGCPYVDFLPDVFVSITHTDRLVACAVSNNRVGIDAEPLSLRKKTVEKRVFTENEINLINNSSDENTVFFTLWTLKEAYLKAIGTGFSDNAKDIEFSSLYPSVLSNKKEFKFLTETVDGYIVSYCEKQIN